MGSSMVPGGLADASQRLCAQIAGTMPPVYSASGLLNPKPSNP